MKKLHSLFILSILALTMFVGCQMPTDGTETTDTFNVSVNESRTTVDFDVQKTATVNETVVLTIKTSDEVDVKVIQVITKDEVPVKDCQKDSTKKYFTMPASDVEITVTLKDVDDSKPVDDTPTVADFVDATDYDVYKDGNFLATIKGKILNAICKNEGFVKDTDYTIEGNKVTVITGSRLYDWLTPQNLGGLVSDDEGGNGNGESGSETPSDTYKVFHINDNGNYVIDSRNLKSSYAVGETVTLPIKTPDYKTPTGLYLVKTYVTDADNNSVEVTYKDHTVSFKMPDSNVTVRADFEEVVCRRFDWEKDSDDYQNLLTVETLDTKFQAAFVFDEKEYDNLEKFNDIYKFVLPNPEYYTNGLKYCYDFYIHTNENYNPVVIYKGVKYEPVVDEAGWRDVDLSSQN